MQQFQVQFGYFNGLQCSLWILGKIQDPHFYGLSYCCALQLEGNLPLCLISHENHGKNIHSNLLFLVFFLMFIQTPIRTKLMLFPLFCLCIHVLFLCFSYSCIFSILHSEGGLVSSWQELKRFWLKRTFAIFSSFQSFEQKYSHNRTFMSTLRVS